MSRILIVDDEINIRRVVKEYAEFEGYEVGEAANGMEAVELVKNNDYDLIVMDIMMPKLDGFSTCKEIKKYGEETKVAVRSIRRDTMEAFKNMKKNSEITEDDLKDCEKEIQNLTDKFCKNIDSLVSEKEHEIMSL